MKCDSRLSLSKTERDRDLNRAADFLLPRVEITQCRITTFANELAESS